MKKEPCGERREAAWLGPRQSEQAIELARAAAEAKCAELGNQAWVRVRSCARTPVLNRYEGFMELGKQGVGAGALPAPAHLCVLQWAKSSVL